MINLRDLEPSDVPRIAELERELFGMGAWSEAMIAEEVTGWGRWYVVAEYVSGPTLLIGYAGLWFDGEVTQVMTIGIDPAYQNRGVGRALLQNMVERSRQLEAAEMFLEVAVDNEPALALYRSFGFEALALRKRYYQPGNIDAYTMRLPLK